MRRLTILLILVLYAVSSQSQTTTTTATVRYPDGQPFINGTVQAVFTPPSGVQDQGLYKLNGAAFPYFVNGVMDATGTFSLTLTDDHKVQPQGGRWNFTVCSQASVPCNSGLQDVFGASIDLSTLISADVSSIRGAASNLPRYYSDSEVDTNGVGGQTYYNLVSGTVRCWDGSSWADCGSGGGGVPSGSTLVITPNVLHFNQQQNGTPSAVQSITLNNVGTSPIIIFGSTQAGNAGQANFKSSDPNHCNVTIPGNSSCTLLYFYQPTGATSDTAKLTFTSNLPIDPGNPLTVDMDGSGTPLATFNVTVDGDTSTGTGFLISEETIPLINGSINSQAACVGDCGNSYSTGTSVTVDATPTNGGTFDHYTGTGSAVACSTNPSCAFTVTADSNLSATFLAPIPTFSLNIVAGPGQGQGTITSNDSQINCTITSGVLSGPSCHGVYNQGATPVLTETPFAGCVGGACTFNSWGGVLNCSNTSTCTPTMNNNINASASFSLANAGAPLQLIQLIPGGTQTSNSIAGIWSQAQQVGDTNIIGIQLNDATTTITSVTDAAGNTYSQLGGGCSPSVGNGFTTAIYIANNIVASPANTNTVVVLLSASPSYRAILGHEYSGLQNPPIDVCNKATGASSTVSAGNITTTNANDLLFSNSVVSGGINVPSPGWTQQIHFKGNDTEDRAVTATGTYNNSTTQTGSTFSTIEAAFKTQGIIAVQFSINIIGASGSTGSGTVTGPGLNCPITNGVAATTGCSTIVAANTAITINGIPLSGSAFVNYQGSGCTNNPQCTTQSITTNTVIAVNFAMAGQASFFVNKSTGSDANSGLCAVAGTPVGCTGPFQTFKKASTAATLGATGTIISFAPANYDEAVVLTKSGTTNARFSFVCNTGITVGGSNCRMREIDTYGVNNVDIGVLPLRGFEIVNSGGIVGINNNGNFSGGVANHFLGNYLHNIAVGACPSSGAILAGQHGSVRQTGLWAIGNIIDLIGNFPSSCSVMQGIYFDVPGALVQNNIITRVAAGGIQYYDAACSAVITNNVLVNNRIGLILYGGNGCTPGFNTVSNNVISNNLAQGISNGFSAPAGDCSSGRNSLFSNNIMFGNPQNFSQPIPPSGCETRPNLLSENPTSTFVSYTGDATGDYHLKGPSIANHGGTKTCVNGGITPCTPVNNFANSPVANPINIGVY